MLETLINSLSKEEIRHYKLLSQGVKNTGARLDFELFDNIKKFGPEKGEVKFKEQHYFGNANAFYRLKNRVFTQLSKTLLYLHHSNTVHHDILENVLLAKVFYQKEQFGIAHHCLKKAEKKAIEIDDFDYLNLIYRELIKLSYEVVDINPEMLIAKQKAVYKKQQKINELNNVLAIVNHQLRRSQNLGRSNNEINNLLQRTINNYTNDDSIKDSYQFQFSIYQAITQFLLRQQNWVGLQEFVIQKLKEFEKKNLFSKANHDTKLQMITYVVNASFKKEDLEVSLLYTERLYDEMLRFGKAHYHKYLFFYYQALVMNFSDSKPEKARRILNEIKDDKSFVSNPYYVQFILLNLALVNHGLGNYCEAMRSMKELLGSTHFAGFEASFKNQTECLYLVLLYENEDFETVAKRVLALELNSSFSPNQLLWLNILKLLSNRKDFKISNMLKQECSLLFKDGYVEEKEESYIFNFNEWILKFLD